MSSDGYNCSLLQGLYQKQAALNLDLFQISEDLQSIKNIPDNIDKWIESVSDGYNKFTIEDYHRMFKIGREFNKVMEEKELNASKIKAAVIDNLLDQIKYLLGD